LFLSMILKLECYQNVHDKAFMYIMIMKIKSVNVIDDIVE